MKITVLWEDQRGGGIKSFGPHELLVSCVTDELHDDLYGKRTRVAELVEPIPCKGVANVRKKLRDNLERLRNSGPVFAVVDRDKVIELWPADARPTNCHAGIVQAFKGSQDFDLLLLGKNVESLIDASQRALGFAPSITKPTPNERDRVLNKAAWSVRSHRDRVREQVASFDRLVARVSRQIEAYEVTLALRDA